MTTTRIANSEEVLKFVADASGVSKVEITSRSRTKSPSRARSVAAYVLRNHCNMSYTEIGRVLDRDHSTVMRTIDSVDLEEPHVKTIYERVMKSISSVTVW